MRLINGIFSSESVSAGHPDKVCDQISDAILDAFLSRDPNARVACETFAFGQRVIVAGEFFSAIPGVFEVVESDAETIARNVLRQVGYTSSEFDVDPAACDVEIAFNQQSGEIRSGVDGNDSDLGAGDQGIMFGYACNETESCMPLAWSLANDLIYGGMQQVGQGILKADGKAQVSIAYEDGKPLGVSAVVLSWQHEPDVKLEAVREFLRDEIAAKVIGADRLMPDCQFHLNPAGRFTKGGPNADTGLTGRKIIVDTYGGAAPHGGGAFSGKDPSKVDRSAAYAARWVAKHLVKSGLAERALVQLAYAIGVSQPVSVALDCSGTEKRPLGELEATIRETFDLSPQGNIDQLGLKTCRYQPTAVNGAFGSIREQEGYAWEQVTLREKLERAIEAKLPPMKV